MKVTPPLRYVFTYVHADHAICAKWLASETPRGTSGFSICMGDLICELGDESEIIECWGYLPMGGWQTTESLAVPSADAGCVVVESKPHLTPGVSARVEGSDKWQVCALQGTQWVYFGPPEPEAHELDVMVAEGLICSVKDHQLVAIWMLIHRE